MLVDAHTHQLSADPQVTAIRSLSFPQERINKAGDNFFHYGSHPWEANHYDESAFLAELEVARAHPHFVALGECGLDRARCENWQQQLSSFQSQIKIAQNLKIHTLVVHCVRAYSEVLQVLKAAAYQGNVIFHDFNAGVEVARELRSHHYYLSLGKTLGRDNSKVRQFLGPEWLPYLLLETDAENLEIKKRYQELEELLGVPVEAAIYENSLRAFNRSNWDR